MQNGQGVYGAVVAERVQRALGIRGGQLLLRIQIGDGNQVIGSGEKRNLEIVEIDNIGRFPTGDGRQHFFVAAIPGKVLNIDGYVGILLVEGLDDGLKHGRVVGGKREGPHGNGAGEVFGTGGRPHTKAHQQYGSS